MNSHELHADAAALIGDAEVHDRDAVLTMMDQFAQVELHRGLLGLPQVAEETEYCRCSPYPFMALKTRRSLLGSRMSYETRYR